MKKELSIDFVQICRDLIRGWWLIAICVIVFGGFGVVKTLDKGVNSYTAETTVYSVTYGALDEVLTGVSVMHQYEHLITSKVIANKAATLLETKDLSGDVIKNMVSYEFSNMSSSSNLVKIHASSLDPNTAIRVADAVAQAFVEHTNNIIGGNSIQIMDEAEISRVYNSVTTDRMKTRLLFAAVGFVLPCIYLVLSSIFSTKVMTVSDAKTEDKIKVIGVIPHNRDI
ncbi:MAG: hypothetical protein IJX86_06400 [Lachnospiraceae bacterium]|nr:hypothetical protein [Lachnospiraceae bacterium]